MTTMLVIILWFWLAFFGWPPSHPLGDMNWSCDKKMDPEVDILAFFHQNSVCQILDEMA